MAESILTSKLCQRCSLVLLSDAFAKSSREKDGLQCWCRNCRKQYRLDNIVRYKENDRKSYLKNPDYKKSLAAQQRLRLGKEKIKEYNSNYYIKNKEVCTQKSKEWREKNKDKLKKIQKTYYENNKIKFYENNKIKWIESPHLVLEACRRRTAAKNNAIPKWADKKAIVSIYKKAKELTKQTGILHQVDHIVPIQSKLVSGLHVHQNLQVITLSQNAAKGNRWWPDMP